MAKENKTVTLTVNSTSKLRFMTDRQNAINDSMENLNKMGARLINIVDGPLQPFGPFGNVYATLTILFEVDTEDPRYQAYIKELEEETQEKQSQNSGGCYVATAIYGSYDCPEVWTLRRYRDYRLAETLPGRLFVALYYSISPTLVKWFGETQWFKKIWKTELDKMVERLNREGIADTPYQDRQW